MRATEITIAENTLSGSSIHHFTGIELSGPLLFDNSTGGEDNMRFTLSGGTLKTNFVPDHSSPVDTNTDNIYNVKVKKVEQVRFAETTYSETLNKHSYNYTNHNGDNYYGGFYNASNYPNYRGFAGLNQDGGIVSWGNAGFDQNPAPTAPTGTGYTRIFSHGGQFAALTAAGAIKVRGTPSWGPGDYTDPPTGTGFTDIVSNWAAAATLDPHDGSVKVWGHAYFGGATRWREVGWQRARYTIAPQDTGYVKLFSAGHGFTALKSDGSLSSWGIKAWAEGSIDAPTDNDYQEVYSTERAFAAVKSDGTLTTWGSKTFGGDGSFGGNNAPATVASGTKIYGTAHAFALLTPTGEIKSWGGQDFSHTAISAPPAGAGFTKIYPNYDSFAALTPTGEIRVWGNPLHGGNQSHVPVGTGFTKVNANYFAFAALTPTGEIKVWGDATKGGNQSHVPAGGGFTKIYSNAHAFAALKSDGSIASRGDATYGGSGAPSGTGFVDIYSNEFAFVAIKADGTRYCWGHSDWGGTCSTGARSETISIRIINMSTLHYDANSGTGTMSPETHTGSATLTLSANTFVKTGYTFSGWNTQANGRGTGYTHTQSFVMPTRDTTLYAQWSPNTNTTYTVEHYLQNSDKTTYPTSASQTDNNTGTTDSTIGAGSATFTGYTYDATDTNNIQTGSIAPDGSLVLKRYYSINTYTLTFEENGGTTTTNQTSIAHNTTATQPTDPERTGYVFGQWFTDDNQQYDFSTPVTQDITLHARWIASDQTIYKINHYKQNPDQTYPTTPSLQEVLTGTTDTIATATLQHFTGWTYDASSSSNVISGSIAPDSSLVLSLYYTIDTYTASFDTYSGSVVDPQADIPHNTYITRPTDPNMTGYIFGGWHLSGATDVFDFSTAITADITLYAKRNPAPDTPYTVEHYKQGSDGTYPPTATEVQHLTGTTDAIVTITPRTYPLWIYDANHTDNTSLSGAILPDGSRVFKLYYRANHAPALEVRNATITKGNAFDLMSLITKATDYSNIDLTSQVTITSRGGFDPNKEGNYTITYSVTHNNQTTEARSTISVVAPSVTTSPTTGGSNPTSPTPSKPHPPKSTSPSSPTPPTSPKPHSSVLPTPPTQYKHPAAPTDEEIMAKTKDTVCSFLKKEDAKAGFDYRYDEIDFADQNADDSRYTKAIENLLHHCLVQGIGDDHSTYGIEKNLTIAEARKIFVRLSLISYSKYESTDHWSTRYFEAGEAQNLWKDMQLKYNDANDAISLGDFMNTASVVLKSIKGKSSYTIDTTTLQSRKITRGEAAIVIAHMIEHMYGK